MNSKLRVTSIGLALSTAIVASLVIPDTAFAPLSSRASQATLLQDECGGGFIGCAYSQGYADGKNDANMNCSARLRLMDPHLHDYYTDDYLRGYLEAFHVCGFEPT
jgi:hypothetical protein